MKRVFFTGAGGTGKTTLFVSLASAMEKRGFKVKYFPSVSRSFFASRGISTEAAGLERRESERLTFQKDMFDWYCTCLEKETDTASREGVDYLIADRSPFDHIAYMVYSAPNLITTETLKEVLVKAALAIGADDDAKYLSTVFLFPTLCNWMTKEVLADGMRYAPPGKNLTIQGLIETAMHGQFIPYHTLGPEAPVDMRTDFVLSQLGIR